MDGVLVQVSVSGGGVPKRPVAEGLVTRGGIVGDRQADRRHHGGPSQALCLFDAERLEALAAEGFPIFPGALGENLTTRGVDYGTVRIGDVYAVGDRVRFEITKPRVPCRTLHVYGASIVPRLWGPAVPWGESGFYARVLHEGPVRAGAVVWLERPGPRAPPPFTRKLAEAGGDPGG